MFPGLRSPSRWPAADYLFKFVHRHVFAVALEGDGFYTTKGLRFEVPSFSCGWARWTRVAHLDLGLARRGEFGGRFTISAASRAGESREGVVLAALRAPRRARFAAAADGRQVWFYVVSLGFMSVSCRETRRGHCSPRRPPLSNDLGAGGDGRGA